MVLFSHNIRQIKSTAHKNGDADGIKPCLHVMSASVFASYVMNGFYSNK